MENELKDIIYKLLFGAFKQAEYFAAHTIEATVKENEFLGICREITLSNLYEEHAAAIKNSDFVLDYSIRTFKFTPLLPDNERTTENYIDFLAYALTPMYEETNKKELQSEEYIRLTNEQKYELWESILFKAFVETFESYAVIEIINEQKNTDTDNNKQLQQIPLSEKRLKSLQEKGFIENIEVNPLNWIGTIKELNYFINKHYYFEPNKWEKAVNTFVWNNTTINKKSLSTAIDRYDKEPERSTIIDNL